jgi:hypothetical protein
MLLMQKHIDGKNVLDSFWSVSEGHSPAIALLAF